MLKVLSRIGIVGTFAATLLAFFFASSERAQAQITPLNPVQTSVSVPPGVFPVFPYVYGANSANSPIVAHTLTLKASVSANAVASGTPSPATPVDVFGNAYSLVPVPYVGPCGEFEPRCEQVVIENTGGPGATAPGAGYGAIVETFPIDVTGTNYPPQQVVICVRTDPPQDGYPDFAYEYGGVCAAGPTPTPTPTPVPIDLSISTVTLTQPGGSALQSDANGVPVLQPGANTFSFNFTPSQTSLQGVQSLTAGVNLGESVQESNYGNNISQAKVDLVSGGTVTVENVRVAQVVYNPLYGTLDMNQRHFLRFIKKFYLPKLKTDHLHSYSSA